MSLKIPDLRLDQVSLEAHIKDNCVPKVVRDTGQWHCIHFSKDGRSRTIQFMLAPTGAAKGYITRNPDDTIEEACADSRCRADIFHNRNWMIAELKTTVTANLLRRTILEWNPEKAAAVITCPENGPRVRSLIDVQASRITVEATQTAVTPGGRRTLFTSMFLQESNRLIREQILNKDVYSLTKCLYPKEDYQAQLHNDVVSNLTTLAHMNAQQPTLLRMACRLLPAEQLLTKDPEGIDNAPQGAPRGPHRLLAHGQDTHSPLGLGDQTDRAAYRRHTQDRRDVIRNTELPEPPAGNHTFSERPRLVSGNRRRYTSKVDHPPKRPMPQTDLRG